MNGDIGTKHGDIIIEMTANDVSCLQHSGLIAVTPEQAKTAEPYGWKVIDPKDYGVVKINPPVPDDLVIITRSAKDREAYASSR